MKRKLTLFFATNLLISSNITTLCYVINHSEIKEQNINTINTNINNQNANKYANETSIVAKALLIGQSQGFNTNDLLNNMYNQNQSNDINNLTVNNSGNDFINSWTTNLDGNSINLIQRLFQRHGVNQDSINKIENDIHNYKNYISYLPMVKTYLNNSILSQDNTVNILNHGLRVAKTLVPDIDNYLSYSTTYLPMIVNTVKELLNDWDQPQNFVGDSLLVKMKDYMSKKATYAQAWQSLNGNDNWHYVETRASNWNWTQFYEYVAGVNFNYIFKLVSGEYIGDMISDNIYLKKLSFDSTTFLKTFSAAINKIINNPITLPYLVKTIVPVLKSRVLKMENPTLGINKVTWKDNNLNKNVVIETVLLDLQYLLSPQGHNDLISLIADLLSGPFGEDIIIKVTPFWIDTFYTLPEIFSTYSWIIKIHDIATKIADSLTNDLKSIPIDDYINKIITFTNKYLTSNPVIDLQDLAKYLILIVNNNDFITALSDVKDIIDNPNTTTHNAKEVLEKLGVQFNGQSTFKARSVLGSLTAWLNSPNSSINQLLAIIQGDQKHPGIIDNMIKEEQTLYQDKYLKYFDMNNSTYFTISYAIFNKYKNDDGTISVILSYKMLDKLNNKSYQLSFINSDFVKSKNFKINLFHEI